MEGHKWRALFIGTHTKKENVEIELGTLKPLLTITLIALIISGFALVNQIHFSKAAIPVSGIIASNTIWTEANSPYDLTGNVLVNDGITLTIEPGVTVNLNNYYIMVNGTLQAIGNSADPITCSGGQITFAQYSTNWTESTGTGCIIQNAVLSSGISVEGGELNFSNNTITGSISVNGGNPNISNNTILSQGISLGLYSRNSTISNNIISGCSAGISTLTDYNSSSTIQGNLILNNTIGIQLGAWPSPEPGCPIVQNNTITENTNGISLGSLGDQFSPTILYNNIWNNTNYNIVTSDRPLNTNASYNWWGTTNIQAIDQSIHDYYDDFNLGKVNYAPFLNETNPNAPAILTGPVISSSTHPNQEVWYTNNDPAFQWTTPSDPSGIAGFSFVIDHSSATIPDGSIDITGNSWSFGDLADGTWYFHVRAKTNLNNWSPVGHYRVNIDTVLPFGSIVISGGTEYSSSISVTLTLTYNDAASGVSQVRYSNDGIWNNEPWEAPSPTRAWTLSSGDGISTVYFQIMDNAGLLSAPFSDTITLDTSPPIFPIIQISNNAAYTNFSVVSLTLYAFDEGSGMAQMCFSNDNSVWSSWEPYATSKFWGLQAGDGVKYVYVQYKDLLGTTATAYDNITLDMTLPVANAGQNQNLQVDQNVTFNGGDSTDNSGIASYFWSFGDGNTSSGVSPTHTYSKVGTYTVSLMVTDVAGNSAASASTVTVEVVIPEFPSTTIVLCILVTVSTLATVFRKKLK